jgi:hypothetical protein
MFDGEDAPVTIITGIPLSPWIEDRPMSSDWT